MNERDSSAGMNGDDGEDEDGFDYGIILEYLRYVVRAVRLHPRLVAAVSVCIILAVYGVLKGLPKTYHVESRILAQRDTTLSRERPKETDPLKGAPDIVLAHEHMASLVKQLDLVSWWRLHESPLQRVKAKVMGFLGRQITDEEQTRMLIDILVSRMNVWTGDGTVTFVFDWPEPEMAARIVDTAEQNFLERRHVVEISTIAESVSILEAHAAKVRKELEELVQAARPAEPDKPTKAADGAAKPAAFPAMMAGARRPVRRPEVEAELARQKVIIETKRRAIADLEEFRQRRLLELQANLAEQRSKYTEAHPVIVGIQQNIASISKESPQVATLRSEVAALQEAFERMTKEAEGPEPHGGAGFARVASAAAGEPSGPLVALTVDRDSPAYAQVGYASEEYAQIRNQISAARIELDLAQAAFGYRYTVVLPAEPPIAPIKPKVTLIMAAASLVALLLGVLAAVAAELRSGRLVDRWQVERYLKLPVLAELRLPRDERPEDRS